MFSFTSVLNTVLAPVTNMLSKSIDMACNAAINKINCDFTTEVLAERVVATNQLVACEQHLVTALETKLRILDEAGREAINAKIVDLSADLSLARRNARAFRCILRVAKARIQAAAPLYAMVACGVVAAIFAVRAVMVATGSTTMYYMVGVTPGDEASFETYMAKWLESHDDVFVGGIR